VTDSVTSPPRFRDAPARRRIADDLETNLLVEAGAGSGKTTELVNRMVALLASGTAQVGEIAAVTFTRKASAELRERFQAELERQARATAGGDEGDAAVHERLRSALHDMDQAFVGTIHSFCGRLLRERPLDVGLDPGFEELAADERITLRRVFWEGYLERLVRDEDPVLEELALAGLRASSLFDLFGVLVENPDVDFASESVGPPPEATIGRVRARLHEIVDRGWELMPELVPDPDWDSLQKKIRSLRFTREITGWRDAPAFFDALATICKEGNRGHGITQKRWKDKSMAKAFKEEVDALFVGDAEAVRLLRRWYEHRYALVIRLAGRAAADFQAYRKRSGRLDFQDLLLLTAELLRTRPDARRELGRRYRRLLVDEFQDTDPLQAEIMMLLASEQDDDSGGGDWRTAEPRPGALFVVGDPKQSIYRFRRADIQLYQLVKDRFRGFGGVLELTTNFRSRPPIGALVNEVFSGPDFFPEHATPEQAGFEPLNTLPSPDEGGVEGVFVYDVVPDAANRRAVASDDADRIAAWVKTRVEAGERTPGDFLVLTRKRASIEAYARAFEAWSLPVQVTGAGVGVEEELAELKVVLECMVDPTNPVKVVSALVGLFFGLDYEQLLTHRLAGGGFDAMRPRVEGDAEVIDAIGRLNRWWRASTVEPADVFISHLANEIGLLPFAAAGDLGSLRAGALVYALDTVRAAVLSGEASLPGALAALEAALGLAEAEAPLEPGRADAVRVMNLHQAKGLEGHVVVLADPSGDRDRSPTQHVRRGDDGAALGYSRVFEPGFGGRPGRTVALPADWARWEGVERTFTAAEETRLLYVAVTRAREELWVARKTDKPEESPWAALHPWLDEHAERVELERREAPPPSPLEPGATERVEQAARAAAERVGAAGSPGYSFISVTSAAKDAATSDDGTVPAGPKRAARDTDSRFRGFSWGSAVHGALAVATENLDADALRATCRSLLVEHGRPVDDHGDPLELAELIELVTAVRKSELWSRAGRALRVYTEIPLAARTQADGRTARLPSEKAAPRPGLPGALRQLDLFGLGEVMDDDAGAAGDFGTGDGAGLGEPDGGAPNGRADGPVLVTEGVIDLVFEEPEGWVVVDYKTDVGTDPKFEERLAGYRRQVDHYADAWGALTGDPVKERVLFFTTQDRVERW
jgi:ATP-dependent helicase/nuclease subunit A